MSVISASQARKEYDASLASGDTRKSVPLLRMLEYMPVHRIATQDELRGRVESIMPIPDFAVVGEMLWERAVAGLVKMLYPATVIIDLPDLEEHLGDFTGHNVLLLTHRAGQAVIAASGAQGLYQLCKDDVEPYPGFEAVALEAFQEITGESFYDLLLQPEMTPSDELTLAGFYMGWSTYKWDPQCRSMLDKMIWTYGTYGTPRASWFNVDKLHERARKKRSTLNHAMWDAIESLAEPFDFGEEIGIVHIMIGMDYLVPEYAAGITTVYGTPGILMRHATDKGNPVTRIAYHCPEGQGLAMGILFGTATGFSIDNDVTIPGWLAPHELFEHLRFLAGFADA